MPAFPPRAAVLAELRRAQAARQEHHRGTVTLAGRTYEGAVDRKPLRHVLNENGLWELRQKLQVIILKALLPTAPAKKTDLIHQGITYRIDEDIAGFDANEPAWIITASRKADAP